MAQPTTKKGLPLMGEPNSETITMSKDDFKAIIAESVKAAVEAANTGAAVQPVSQPTSPSRIILENDYKNRLIENERLAKAIDNEDKVYFSIPSIYAVYTPTVVACVNGQSIKIPVDGVPRLIPARYIPIIQQYIDNIDKKVAAMHTTQAAGQYGGIAQITESSF